ncbi:MAG: Sensor protein, partial [uncultured bacterium]
MRKTIQTPVLFLGIILFIVLCTVAYIALDYRNKSREHFQRIGSESPYIEVVTLEYFDKYISVLRTLSELPCIKEKNGGTCDAVLKKLNNRFPGVVNFAVLDRKGYFFASGLPFDRANPPSIRKLEFFGDLQQGADMYIMNPHIGPISGVKLSGVIIRLSDPSRTLDGFVGVSIRFSELESLWRKSAETFNHGIIIADRAAMIHFASAPFTKLIGKSLPEIGLPESVGSGDRGEISIDSKRYTVHVRDLKHGGLSIVELSPLYTFTGVYAEKHPQVLFVGIALFLAVIVSFLLIGQSKILAVKLSMAEKESYRLMEMILQSRFAFAVSNAEKNTIEMTNEAFAALYGYSPKELKNRGISDLFAPESHEELAKMIKIIHEKGVHSFELLHVRKDGTRFPAEVYATAIRDERGKVVNRIVNVQDITRRKQTKEALKRSEEKFNKAFQNSPDAITITRASDGLLMDVNAALLRLSGYAREEVIGKTSVELDLWASKEDRDRYVSTLREKGRVADFEADFRTKSGEILNCLLSGEIYDIGGEILILGIIRDITARKKADEALKKLAAELEERIAERTAEIKENQRALINLVEDLNQKSAELEEANERLKEVDRLKSMFIASMSHELRTPLNSIIGFTGIILMGMSGRLSEVQRKQLGMVKNSANHLLALINDVIDVSKIEAGKVDLDSGDFDLSSLVREVMESFAVTAAEKGLHLDLKAADEISVKSD